MSEAAKTSGAARVRVAGAPEAAGTSKPAASPQAQGLPEGALVVYVSFPFTLKSPSYGPGQPYIADSAAKAAYVDALEAELASLDEDVRARPVVAVRLGGGASIAKADKVCKLVRDIRSTLNVVPRAEISIEVNPLTVGTPSLTDWTSCGINRVLLGARSVHDDELTTLGTSHVRQDVDNALRFLALFRMTRIDMRLTYGLPGQTSDSWKKTLLTAVDEGVEHITALPLVDDAPERAKDLPNDAAREAMAGLAREVLGAHGYREYAIGRFVRTAAPHAVDRFDVAVRAGAGQLGLGALARSSFDGFLYENTGDFDEYVAHSAEFDRIVRDPRREGAAATQARRAQAAFDELAPFTPGADAADTADGKPAPELLSWLNDLAGSGCAERDPRTGAWSLTPAGRARRARELGAQELL